MKKLLLALSAGMNISCGNPLIETDLILYNGPIYTVDSSFSVAEAMAITNGKIVAVGKYEDVFGTYSSKDSINLNGTPVYPGLIDAHCHFMGYADGLGNAELIGASSWEETVARLIAFRNSHPDLPYLVGRGWDQNDWPGKKYPDRRLLDDAFPDIPVVLSRVDGHAIMVNRAALEMSGITTKTRIQGGDVVVENGELTGLLIDNAETLVQLPPKENQIKADLLKKAEQNIFKKGLTYLVDAGLPLSDLQFIRSLQDKGDLKVRFYGMVSDGNADIRRMIEQGPIQTERMTIRSFKFYSDGALGSRGALLREPYSDMPGHFGLPVTSYHRMDSIFPILAKAGFQVNTHAIGDSATHLITDLYLRYMPEGGEWRIEHAQVMGKEDIERACGKGVWMSVQPTHATSDAPWAEERLGHKRIKKAYSYQQMIEICSKVALGTDFPVENISPFLTFRSAISRKDPNNQPEGGFRPDQALSRMDALRGMTIWAARSVFADETVGSLEPGKSADFIVLDRDIMNIPDDEILKVTVLNTYIAGERVH
ncbi:MAG: amidohydrolase [Bacteroidota bacterium]|nr:amidohydrolase [Bacteroidota bacterium]